MNAKVKYEVESNLTAAEFVDVLRRSSLAERRPVDDTARVESMLQNAQIVISASVEDQLIGVARAISDFSYCTYLSDVAVDRRYQRQGIGKELIRRAHQAAGLQTTLILLAAPAARQYYPRIGMKQHDSCWITPGESR